MSEDIYGILFSCFCSILSGAAWVWVVFLNGATSLVEKAKESDDNPQNKIYGFVYTPPMIKLAITLIFFGNIFMIYLTTAEYIRNHS